jgi:hypothetical protein
LGLRVEATVSPRVLAKMVYAGASASFPQAQADLENLANLSISSERVRRACHQAGKERIAEHAQQQAAYDALPLPQQISGKPEAQTVECSPKLDPCVMRVQPPEWARRTFDEEEEAHAGTDHQEAA